jgi:neurotransmitter:Na+ symporter, NSS family
MKAQREHWSSRLGFIMAAAGAAIGLGTLWMFPYLTGENGGGAFVLIYLGAMLLVGFPIFIAELLLGRAAQKAPVGIFSTLANNSPAWKMVGWLAVTAAFFIMSYYSVVAGWGLNYLLLSATNFYEGRTLDEITGTFDLLQASGDIVVFWHLVFTAMAVGVVFMGIRNGIEYWSKIITSSLLVILLALFLYGTTLSGFSEALHYVFYPDLTKLKPSSVLEALGLAFFTLSLGQGAMLTYGSYMNEEEDIPKTALIVVSMDLVVSLLSAMMIFPMIFTFGFEPNSGPGLIFKVLPVTFAQLPASSLLSLVFFSLFVFTALTTAVSFVEVMVANTIEVMDWSRKKSCVVVGITVFLFGIPSALSGCQGIFPTWEAIYGKNFFDVISSLVSNWILPVGGLLTATFTGWHVGRRKCLEEFCRGSSWKFLFKPWFFMIRWLAPIATFLIILNKAGVFDIDMICCLFS